MASNTTFDDLTQARPQRGTGAPERAEAQYDRILNLLIERKATGEKYVYAGEMDKHPELYGRSPRNRISEMRTKAGHQIGGESYGNSDWRYWLIALNPCPPPRRLWAGSKKKTEQQPLAPGEDWYKRDHGPRPGWRSRPFSEKRMADPNCFRLTPPEPRR